MQTKATTELNGNTAIVTYEFSQEEIDVLKHLKEHGYKEFRNGENSVIVDDLYDYGFVTDDSMSWHYTVKLTNLGESLVKDLD